MKKTLLLGTIAALAAGSAVTTLVYAQAASTHLCTPSKVGVGGVGSASERVVVTCTTSGPNGSGGNTIAFFAIGASDAARANRYMTLASSALISGRRIRFSYPHSGNTSGCGAADCRTPSDYTME
jgi:hypothetical protein